MYAAAEKNLPIICPGWEDSTMGNIFASYVLKGELQGFYDEERHRVYDLSWLRLVYREFIKMA